MASLKTLLDDIKTQLDTDVTEVKSTSIFIVDEEEPVNDFGVEYPYLLLKDGGDENIELSGANQLDVTIAITIVQELIGRSEDSESIMGDGSSKGVLAFADDIRSSLRNFRTFTGSNSGKSLKTIYVGSNPTEIPESEEGGNSRAFKTLFFNFSLCD